MLFTARGPWLHITLLAVSLEASLIRGAAAAQPNEPLDAPEAEPAATSETPAATSEATAAQARVGALINQGQARFETADYLGAIERWTEAYAQLPDDPHLAAARNLLTYQIAQAHIEAHTIDPKLSHLRKAERLLRQYIAALDPSEAEARADAEPRLTAVHAQIEAATPPPPVARPAAPEPAPLVRVPPGRSPGPSLLLGGISLGLGGAMLVGSAVSATARARIDAEARRAVEHGASAAEFELLLARGNRAHQATIVTGVVGGVLIAAGVALLVTSRVRKRALTARPTLAPGFVGAGLALRF